MAGRADRPNTESPSLAVNSNTLSLEHPVHGRSTEFDLPPRNRNPSNDKGRAATAASAFGSAVGGFAKALPKGVYLDMPHALEEGLRVAPRLYGGEVYDPGPVTDWKSGGIAAGKNFGHGIQEGVGGLVMSPVRGAKEGAIGAAKGVGIGVLNLTTKVTSGTLGLLTFSCQGVYKSARASMRADTGRFIKESKQAEGIVILRGEPGSKHGGVDAEAVLRIFHRQKAQVPEDEQWIDMICVQGDDDVYFYQNRTDSKNKGHS